MAMNRTPSTRLLISRTQHEFKVSSFIVFGSFAYNVESWFTSRSLRGVIFAMNLYGALESKALHALNVLTQLMSDAKMLYSLPVCCRIYIFRIGHL